jgi:hypothetical protein
VLLGPLALVVVLNTFLSDKSVAVKVLLITSFSLFGNLNTFLPSVDFKGQSDVHN